jgi:uncharacterized protein (DUF58 family)
MLLPTFHELAALKCRSSKLMHSAKTPTRSLRAGNYVSPFRGPGLEFDSVREYVPGCDDIRQIDWRVTARIGAPHIKLFREERERQVFFCVDRNSSMQFGTKNTFKSVQAAKVAALLGWAAIGQNDPVGAYLFGGSCGEMQFFPPNRTNQSFARLLHALCREEKGPDISCSTALQIISRRPHTGALIYLLSDFLDGSLDDPEFEASLSILKKKCDLVFLSINDPADGAIYPLGELFFSGDKEEEPFLADTDNAAGQKAYQALWSHNRAKLKQVTAKYRIPLISLTTESKLPEELYR